MKKLLTLIVLTFTSTSILAGGTHSHGHGKASFSVGEPAEGKPDRVFNVSMRDTMRFVFSPEFENLREGEVIRFNLRNEGAIAHEFSIGNRAEQIEHAKMMRKMPNMKHDDPNAVILEPGKTATLMWRFKGGETVVFACNIPGHYEAGMHHRLAMLGTVQAQ